jgi:hypothetical protein
VTEQIGKHPRLYPEIDLSRRIRETQNVAAKIGRVQSSGLGILDKHMANRRRAAQWLERRHHLDEDVPGRSAPWPTIVQIHCQRLGDRREQRKCESHAGLWPRRQDGTSDPIDIVELQSDRLAGAEFRRCSSTEEERNRDDHERSTYLLHAKGAARPPMAVIGAGVRTVAAPAK